MENDWSTGVQGHDFVVSCITELRRAGVCMEFDNVRWVPYICIELFNIKTHAVTGVVFVWLEGKKRRLVQLSIPEVFISHFWMIIFFLPHYVTMLKYTSMQHWDATL